MLQFTKLRIAGFKSFVDPAELLIEPGLTGVVGPNGCGKSNLIEALRWVMGETSARQMRSGEMDDVIFAGTAQRPGRNVAEVVVELDNSAGSAPPPYDSHEELHVSRRIERAKGSVYRVNGREVRARDVHLLFADAASGARSASMVTQGQVSHLIAAKPAERRALLEEAAGIIGLQTRRHEAELRLHNADANLLRLDDVLATLDAQRKQLQKQARQAARYRRVSERIRALEAAILSLKWRAAEAALARAADRLASAETAVADATGATAEAAARHTDLTAALPDLREADGESAALLSRLRTERDALDAEERRTAQAADQVRGRLRDIARDLTREQTILADASATLDRLAADRARLDGLRAGEAAAIDAARAALSEVAARVEARDQEVLGLTERLAADRAKRSALERAAGEGASRLQRLVDRRQENERQRSAALQETERLPDPDEARTRLADAEAAAAEVPAIEAMDAERARRAGEEAAAATALRAADAALSRLEAEQAALEDVLKTAPEAGRRSLLDGIAIEPGLETALAAALGEDLLASEDEAAPAHWRGLPDLTGAAALPEALTSLASRVEGAPVLARRLSQVAVLDEAADGDRLQPALRPGQRLVSRDGALWRWDGFTRRAGAETPAAVRLRQRARLDQLRALRSEAADARDEAARRHAEARRALGEAQRAEAAARERRKAADAILANARKLLADAAAGRARVDARLAALAESRTEIDAEHAAAVARAEALAAELAALPACEEDQPRLDAVRADLARLRTQQTERRAAVDQLVREAAGRARRLQAIDAETASWAERQQAARGQADDLRRREDEAKRELEHLEALPAVYALRRSTLLDALSAAEQQRRLSSDRLSQAEAAMKDAERATRAAERALADAREERARAQAQREQAEQAVRALAASIADRFAAEPAALEALAGRERADDSEQEERPSGDSLQEREQALERLRRERELMGPVNLRAEQEIAELDAQTEELQRQRTDLLEAIGKLRRGMAELDREGRERLQASFAEIDRHFQTLFGRLFGGGRAHLALVDSEDPLQAGLEIMASPPGKKLQLMSLLSGGEQTLTALALRFALFLLRPAPICVLDEVDAALDDANVDRLCGLLDELAGGGTRFLVVTHHRLTMARMDRLFGVTMVERGASHLVSVDLSRAELFRQSA